MQIQFSQDLLTMKHNYVAIYYTIKLREESFLCVLSQAVEPLGETAGHLTTQTPHRSFSDTTVD